MSDQKKDVNVRITAQDETKGAFASAQAEAKSFGTTVGGVFETIKSHWAMLTGVLAGGALFREVITSTVEWTESVLQLSRRLGVTSEEASGLTVALHHVGLEADDYATVAQKMTKQMRTNEDGFRSLGIATKDVNGEWRNTQAVMGDAIEVLNGMKAGTDRNIASQTLFGARVGNITALLRLNKDMLEESAAKAQKYHLVIGPEGETLVLNYKGALSDLKLVGESLSVQMGERLLPVLLQVSSAMGEQAPRAADGFGKGITFVAKAALEAYAAINALAQTVRFLFVLFTTPVDRNFASTVTKAFHEMGEEVTKVNEQAQNGILQLMIHRPGSTSAGPAGDTLGGDDLKKSKDAHAEYLKALEKEVGELTKAAQLGTLRVENVRRLIQLQEQLLQQASDPRATLEDRNAAQAAANALEKANPIGGIPGIEQTRTGPKPGGKAPPMRNIGPADMKQLTDPGSLNAQVRLADMVKDGFGRATDSVRVTRGEIANLAVDIGDTARNAVDNFASAWAGAAQQIATGATSVGDAVLRSTRKAIGGAAAAKGQETLLDAAKAFALGFHDPSEFVVAAKLFAVGTGYELLAGVLGGSGGGGGGSVGGGGGLSSGSFNDAANAQQGKLTVVWPSRSKSVLNINDPDDQDAIAEMLKKLAGNRQIEFVYGGG